MRDLIAVGRSHDSIERELSHRFGVTHRTIRSYLARVYARMAKIDEALRPHRKAQLVAQLEGLYALAVEDGDFKAGVQIIDKLIRLDGLYAAERHAVEHTGVEHVPMGFTSAADARKYIAHHAALLGRGADQGGKN